MDVLAANTLLRSLDREIWLATARHGTRLGGLITTTVTSLSIVADLPRVSVTISPLHHTWDLIEASQSFALHLLSEANLPLVWRFGLNSGRDIDKFAGLTTREDTTGSPIFDNTLGWLDCRVEASLDIGDRTIYVAQVVNGHFTSGTKPLTEKQVLHLASHEQLAEMKKLLQQDALWSADSIKTWRRGRETPDQS